MSNCFHSWAQRRNRFRVNSLCAMAVERRTAPDVSAEPAGGGHGQDGVFPAVGDGTGEVAVRVHADGDGLAGLRGRVGGHCAGAFPVGVAQRARAVFCAPTGRIAYSGESGAR